MMAATLVYFALIPVSLLVAAGLAFLGAIFSARVGRLKLLRWPSLITLLLSPVVFFTLATLAHQVMHLECGPAQAKPEHSLWCHWFAAP